MFDEMASVVGKYMATINFSKGVGDTDVEPMFDSTLVVGSIPIDVDIDLDEATKRIHIADSSNVASTQQTRLIGNGSCAIKIKDAKHKDLSTQIGKVSCALYIKVY